MGGSGGRRQWDLRYRYGLSVEQFDAMVVEQGDVCGICGRDEPGAANWHVDHNGQCCPGGTKGCGNCVRGLLCRACNLMIGYAGDNVAVLRSAINYLNFHARSAA